MNGSIEFKVKDRFEIGVDTTWNASKEVTVVGRHVRINKEFLPREPLLTIRYPFEMSYVSVQKAIGIGEQSPFAIKYRNVSTKDLGIQSDSKRMLRLMIELVGGVRGCDMMFLGWTSDDKYPLEEAVVHDIEFMPKKSEASFSGTFAFSHPDIAPFTSALLRASLFIGSLKNPSSTFQKIQERNFSVQYTIDFCPNPEAEFILIVNT